MPKKNHKRYYCDINIYKTYVEIVIAKKFKKAAKHYKHTAKKFSNNVMGQCGWEYANKDKKPHLVMYFIPTATHAWQ